MSKFLSMQGYGGRILLVVVGVILGVWALRALDKGGIDPNKALDKTK